MQTSGAEELSNLASALGELHSISRQVALESTPQRSAATRYMVCRDVVLASASRSQLPGFIHQCVSIYKLHDFIHLYHHSTQARLAFLDDAFSSCRPSSASRRTFDVFGDEAEL